MRHVDVVFRDSTDAGTDNTDSDFIGVERFQAIHNGCQRALNVGLDDDIELIDLLSRLIMRISSLLFMSRRPPAFFFAGGGLFGLTAGCFFVCDHLEFVAEFRQCLEASDDDRRRRRGFFEGLAVSGFEVADLGIGAAGYDEIAWLDVPDSTSAWATGPRPCSTWASIIRPAARFVDVGLQLFDVGHQQQHVEQFCRRRLRS